jgi:sugar phosphate isomerase/epimerase
VWLEVHGGGGSADPANIRKIMDYANHPNALVCWNSNSGEQNENGSIQANFDLLKDKIAHVHITEIGVYQYPWRQLFDNLKAINYAGYCLAEIGYNAEPERFMKYYRTLFDLYTGNYRYPQPK